MTTNKLVKTLIGVNKNVAIKNVEINEERAEIFVYVRLKSSIAKRCPICGKKQPGYDTTTDERIRRSLDAGVYKAYIVCEVKRIECKEHGVHTEKVPWARHNSRFTKQFEEQAAYLAVHLTKKECARLMRIAWNTVGPILSRIRCDLEEDLSIRMEGLKIIGIDETSYKKGHKYITTIVDHLRKQVVYINEGKTREGLDGFFAKMTQNQRESIEIVSGDGAKWIAASVKDNLPNANFCIDAFHVVEWVNEALETIRKEIWKDLKQKRDAKPEKGSHNKSEQVRKDLDDYKEIKKSVKYTLLKNPENLTAYQQGILDNKLKFYPRLLRAYVLKEDLRLIFTLSDPTLVAENLKKRCYRASHTKSQAFKDLAKKIKSRIDQIVNTIKFKVSNGLIESFNNKIKVLIKKAYGFGNIENLKDLIYIVCSPLYCKIKPAFEK